MSYLGKVRWFHVNSVFFELEDWSVSNNYEFILFGENVEICIFKSIQTFHTWHGVLSDRLG